MAVEQDGAGAADAVLAADMGAGEPQLVAQEIAQEHPPSTVPYRLAVDRDGDVVGIAVVQSSAPPAARHRPFPVPAAT